MRSIITLLAATAAVVVVASASATTLPLQIKLTVVSRPCQFSTIVPATQVQTTLARRCSGTEVAHVRLPKLLKRPLVIRRGESWVIRLRELP